MYKVLRVLILACSVVLVMPSNANAEIDAINFLRKYDSTTGARHTIYLQYLNGISNGVSWANTYVGRKNPHAKIYCPPKKLALKARQVVTLLRWFVVKYPKYKTLPVGAAMMIAMQKRWPCR